MVARSPNSVDSLETSRKGRVFVRCLKFAPQPRVAVARSVVVDDQLSVEYRETGIPHNHLLRILKIDTIWRKWRTSDSILPSQMVLLEYINYANGGLADTLRYWFISIQERLPFKLISQFVSETEWLSLCGQIFWNERLVQFIVLQHLYALHYPGNSVSNIDRWTDFNWETWQWIISSVVYRVDIMQLIGWNPYNSSVYATEHHWLHKLIKHNLWEDVM